MIHSFTQTLCEHGFNINYRNTFGIRKVYFILQLLGEVFLYLSRLSSIVQRYVLGKMPQEELSNQEKIVCRQVRE
jgi:hypothetical protein